MKNKMPIATLRDKFHSLPDILTIKETADLLRIHPLTLKRWGVKGKLVPIRINKRGDRRYRKIDIMELLGVN